MDRLFETASFHIVKPCNMSCKFCYATFADFRVPHKIGMPEVCDILNKLREAGLQKITFAGGEPMLHPQLGSYIGYAKHIGLTTSIITNGSLLTRAHLLSWQRKLDWVGISIDSLSKETNEQIGRVPRLRNINYDRHYENLVTLIKMYGFKLKINTVVNRYNQHESMQQFIDWANPDRWKIFDTLKVDGQNDEQFEEIRSTDFAGFIARHSHRNMVVENNEAMTGSYLLIDPIGRLFENSSGKHTYSAPLQYSTVEKCLAEIKLNRQMFEKRGGVYAW